jgi:hypothetical protein
MIGSGSIDIPKERLEPILQTARNWWEDARGELRGRVNEEE